MILANYPGHVLAATCLVVGVGVLAIAYASPHIRNAGRWRALFAVLHAAVVVTLLILLWNPSAPQFADKQSRNSVLVLVDSSRSMSVADANGKPRMDLTVETFRDNVLAKLPDGPLFTTYGFDSQAYPVESLNSLHRWGERTDLHEALERVRRYDVPESDRTGGQVVGALVFTDGQATEKSLTSYAPLQHKGLKLVFVGVGDTHVREDIWVKSLQAPLRTGVETKYDVNVTIGKRGTLSTPIHLEVLSDNAVMFAKDIAPDSFAEEMAVRCTLAASTLGSHTITARVAPLPDEVNPDNNIRQTAVEVQDEEPLNVLLYTQQATADIGKIREALERDKKVRLDLGFDVLQGSKGTEQGNVLPGHVPLPRDAAGFQRYDVIILGPMRLNALSPEQMDGLYRFVCERGGGLTILPDTEFNPYADAQRDKLLSLLPAFPGTNRPMASEGLPTLTAEGKRTRIFPEENLAALKPRSTPLFPALQVKPASSVLLTLGNTPLVVTQRVGRGYVALINIRPLYLWYRENQQGGALRVFMSGLTAYLGRTTQRESGVELFVARVPNEPTCAQFDCTVLANDDQPATGANVLLETLGQTVTMTETTQGHYTAKLDIGTAEALSAHVGAEKDSVLLGERSLVATLPAVSGEMDRIEQDRPFLQGLAKRTGGTYYDLTELGPNVASLFESTHKAKTIVEVTPVWRRWPIFVTLCVALTSCWFLRRTKGLM